MAKEGFKRKLTAILSADAVEYSRLMAEDEAATVETICYVSVPATSLATRSLSWRLPLFPMFGVPFRARPYRSVERNT
jgi:hypothetical protein